MDKQVLEPMNDSRGGWRVVKDMVGRETDNAFVGRDIYRSAVAIEAPMAAAPSPSFQRYSPALAVVSAYIRMTPEQQAFARFLIAKDNVEYR